MFFTYFFVYSTPQLPAGGIPSIPVVAEYILDSLVAAVAAVVADVDILALDIPAEPAAHCSPGRAGTSGCCGTRGRSIPGHSVEDGLVETWQTRADRIQGWGRWGTDQLVLIVRVVEPFPA